MTEAAAARVEEVGDGEGVAGCVESYNNNNNNNHFISIVVKPLRRTASTHHIYTEPVLARRPEQPVTNNKV